MAKGTFHTIRIQQSKEVEGEDALKIFGVRVANFLPEGWVLRQELTPSADLLFGKDGTKALKKRGEWNEEAFQTFYLPNFLQGLKQNPKSKEEIYEIATTLNSGKDVYYACYCKDHHLCHRSIVANIFERNGYTVNRH